MNSLMNYPNTDWLDALEVFTSSWTQETKGHFENFSQHVRADLNQFDQPDALERFNLAYQLVLSLPFQ